MKSTIVLHRNIGQISRSMSYDKLQNFLRSEVLIHMGHSMKFNVGKLFANSDNRKGYLFINGENLSQNSIIEVFKM